MNVLIYGAGAVGLGIASCLYKAGEWPVLITRERTAAALRRYGLKRIGIFGEHTVAPEDMRACTSLSRLPQEAVGGFDLVLVCTKSFDTAAAAKDLQENVHRGFASSRFVLFQNGWGNREAFSRHFAPKSIFNARVITGFARPEAHVVEITVHADDIRIGSFVPEESGQMSVLAEAISRGGIPCGVSRDISRDLWAKMLYNCALNSVGALFEMSYGELASHREARRIMGAIVAEVFTVIHTAGYETHWQGSQEYLEDFYRILVPRTSRHYSSTLQDIRAGKRTEIDALNGEVVRLAGMHDVAVPVNAVVYDMVKLKERTTRARRGGLP